MLFLILEYWRWLALAAAIGLLTTVLAARGERRTPAHFLAPLVALLILATLLLAVIAPPLAGRAALYHETALLTFAAYLLGGTVGLIFGPTFPFTYTAWWAGLAAVAFVWIEANVLVTDGIERDLSARVSGAMTLAGGDPLDLEIAGRDVLLLADAGTEEQRAELTRRIMALSGVRLVSEVPKLTGAATDRRENALAEIAAQVAAEKAAREATGKTKVERALREIATKITEAKAAREVAAKAAAEKAARDSTEKASIDKALKQIAAKVAEVKAAREAVREAAAGKAEVDKALKQIAAKVAAAKAARETVATAATEAASAKTAEERAAQEAAATATPASAEMTLR